MKHTLIALILIFLFPNAATLHAQVEQSTEIGKVTVAPSLLKFANLMGFKYLDILERSKKGEINAIVELMEFHGATDGKDAINHALACLEMMPVATDIRCALSYQNMKDVLKKLLLERFEIAQGKTEIEALRRPMKEWAPMSWAALNNLPIDCPTCEFSKKMAGEYQKNPDGTITKILPQESELKPEMVPQPDPARDRTITPGVPPRFKPTPEDANTPPPSKGGGNR